MHPVKYVTDILQPNHYVGGGGFSVLVSNVKVTLWPPPPNNGALGKKQTFQQQSVTFITELLQAATPTRGKLAGTD